MKVDGTLPCEPRQGVPIGATRLKTALLRRIIGSQVGIRKSKSDLKYCSGIGKEESGGGKTKDSRLN